MSLAAGVRIGPYEIQSALGAGGMGEVWRARDVKLARDVALKILPDAFASDPDRLARFQREAQVLASLNHPNIAAIYGLEGQVGGAPRALRDDGQVGPLALVLELVEGPTLADRIARGAVPLDEALAIAKQIADALQAAHDHGIVHRDLKPANIKLKTRGAPPPRSDGALERRLSAADTTDCIVKVLDFGLAKAFDQAPVAVDATHASTLTSPAFTNAGMILGTAAYMAPEQARGKAVDKRADIWAFGVVLYEMLSGHRPFKGETVTDTLAAVIERPPDLDRVPARVRPLLRKCLDKDPSRRLRDIGDAMALVAQDDAPSAAGGVGRFLPWAAAAVFAAAAGVALWAPWRTAAPAQESIRTQVSLPENVDAASRNFVLSPDGRVLAFSAVGADRVPRVWVRFMDSLEVRALPGTETTQTPPQFFWSPDSRFIAYSAKYGEKQDAGRLNVVDLTGTPPHTLTETVGLNATGGSWSRDGVIVFGSVNGPLSRVSASGGARVPITVLDRARGELRHSFPSFLPDGRHFLYLRTTAVPENSGVYIGSIDAKPEEQDSRRLVATTFSPVYVPSTGPGPGYLLFMREGNVLAQAFDEGRMDIVGDPVAVVQQVGTWVASGFFSATSGVLVYRSSSANQDTRLQWWDRGGTFGSTPEQPGGVSGVVISPDGARVAIARPDPAGPTGEIRIWDTSRGSNARLTFGPGRPDSPVWSPDGRLVVFASTREGSSNIYRKPADGSTEDEVLLKSSEDKTPTSISPDGRYLLYTQTDPQTKKDIWVLSNPAGSPGDRKSTPFQRGAADESEARFSPESEAGASAGPRWVAYTSSETGKNEVYVREFPFNAANGNWLVSKGAGGTNPRWRKDGKELFFASADGGIMSVDVTPGAVFQASEPKLLVRVPSGIRSNWDVTPDGKRFLVLLNVQKAAPFTVWQNWQAGLKR